MYAPRACEARGGVNPVGTRWIGAMGMGDGSPTRPALTAGDPLRARTWLCVARAPGRRMLRSGSAVPRASLSTRKLATMASLH